MTSASAKPAPTPIRKLLFKSRMVDLRAKVVASYPPFYAWRTAATSPERDALSFARRKTELQFPRGRWASDYGSDCRVAERHEALRRARGAGRFFFGSSPGRIPDAARRERQREDHHPPPGRGLRAAGRGPGFHRRPGYPRASALSSQRQHGLPALRAFSSPQCGEERGLRFAPEKTFEPRNHQARWNGARHGGLGRERRAHAE